jgi:hypothetical protein
MSFLAHTSLPVTIRSVFAPTNPSDLTEKDVENLRELAALEQWLGQDPRDLKATAELIAAGTRHFDEAMNKASEILKDQSRSSIPVSSHEMFSRATWRELLQGLVILKIIESPRIIDKSDTLDKAIQAYHWMEQKFDERVGRVIDRDDMFTQAQYTNGMAAALSLLMVGAGVMKLGYRVPSDLPLSIELDDETIGRANQAREYVTEHLPLIEGDIEEATSLLQQNVNLARIDTGTDETTLTPTVTPDVILVDTFSTHLAEALAATELSLELAQAILHDIHELAEFDLIDETRVETALEADKNQPKSKGLSHLAHVLNEVPGALVAKENGGFYKPNEIADIVRMAYEIESQQNAR